MNGAEAVTGKLRERQIEARQRIDGPVVLESAALLDVADHSNNFARDAAREDVLPHRIAILEVPPRERLVDDSRWSRRLGVAIAEGAAPDERQPQRFKVA